MTRCSVCIHTYDKADHLRLTLHSIFRQKVPNWCEVIVVDDGSPTDYVRRLCLREFSTVKYHRIERDTAPRDPAAATTVAFRLARGEVIIAQDDDIVHEGDCIQALMEDLEPKTYVVATVDNVDFDTLQQRPLGLSGSKRYFFTHPSRHPRPYLLFGAVWREDIYAVGGCDERFGDRDGGSDTYLADCLRYGRKLQPKFSQKAVGHHLHHYHIRKRNMQLLNQLRAEGRWMAASGPWPYKSGKGALDVRHAS